MLKIRSYLYLLMPLLLITACSSLPTDIEKKPSYAFTDTKNTWLGKSARNVDHGHAENSSVYLISEGTDAFLTRMALLKKAERSVDVQYFIWKSDIIGKFLMNSMIEVADKGVRVRMLLDDLTLDDQTKDIIFSMDHHDNIDVRIYNPFSVTGHKGYAAITDTSRINRRMHNKSFTVDNQFTVVGGRNIEENYFSANEMSNYDDSDVVAVGPVVNDVSSQFDLYFNSPLAIPAGVFSEYEEHGTDRLIEVRKELNEFVTAGRNSKYAQDLTTAAFYQQIDKGIASRDDDLFYQGKAHVIYDNPDKTMGKSKLETTYLVGMLRPHVSKINNTLELISPYFIPGEKGTAHLVALAQSGVKVKVITNSLASTDGIMAQSGYARYRYDMLKGGIELYELKTTAKSDASRSLTQSAEAKSALHAKVYIFDRKEVFVGSFNFDPRSAEINTELGIVYEIPDMAEFIGQKLFGEKLADITYKLAIVDDEVVWIDTTPTGDVVYDIQPETSWWRRFNLGFYSILPIESQL